MKYVALERRSLFLDGDWIESKDLAESGIRYLNPDLKGRDMREAFDTNDYHVMIVAQKFQTGFDQPKLCAM